MAKKRDVSRFAAGQMIRSDAGHDKGKLYVILKQLRTEHYEPICLSLQLNTNFGSIRILSEAELKPFKTKEGNVTSFMNC